VVNVDRLSACCDELKADEQLSETTELRLVLYLNNQVEQDHRFIKRQNREWALLPLIVRWRSLRGME